MSVRCLVIDIRAFEQEILLLIKYTANQDHRVMVTRLRQMNINTYIKQIKLFQQDATYCNWGTIAQLGTRATYIHRWHPLADTAKRQNVTQPKYRACVSRF